MIKNQHGSGQGGVVSCAKVRIVEGAHGGGRDVLLLGDHTLMLDLNGLEPEGVLYLKSHRQILTPPPPPPPTQTFFGSITDMSDAVYDWVAAMSHLAAISPASRSLLEMPGDILRALYRW